QRFVFGAAVGLHVSSVGQDDRLRVADGGPTGGRRDGSPDIFYGIVNRALIDPGRVAGSAGAVILSTLDDHAPVGKYDGTKVEWSVTGGGVNLRPGSVDVTAAAIGRELVPGAVIRGGAVQAIGLGVSQDGSVGQQKHC